MRFMITFNHIDGAWDRLTETDRKRVEEGHQALQQGLADEQGTKLVFFAPHPAAKTVRQHADGSIEVSDGPSKPGAEQPGGYYIVEAESMDAAVEWAIRGRFMVGSNEVRQIVDMNL